MRYKDDMIERGVPEKELVVLSSFYQIWHDDFPNVVIPEV